MSDNHSTSEQTTSKHSSPVGGVECLSEGQVEPGIPERAIPRRDPNAVMRLSRLGSLHQCRLSFMRTLTRRMAEEEWQFKRLSFDINDNGVGYAVYRMQRANRCYSLVAFAHDLPDEQRSDRVIAEAWDATFALFDGEPCSKDIARLANNVPYQEAGRVTQSELTLSRANRSVRLWRHVVGALASGRPPDKQDIESVGYLMRTTAVYGSGKFGALDREEIEDREELYSPFQAELLTVYLIRTFVRDLVNHMAEREGGTAAITLDSDVARYLGIGNSTGLGMAPFIVNHPVLFNNWIMAREEAIARVRNVIEASDEELLFFKRVFQSSVESVRRWKSDHPLQQEKLQSLRADLEKTNDYLQSNVMQVDYPWHALVNWSETNLSEEGQELIVSLMLEPYPHLVDGVTHCMSDSNKHAFTIDGSMKLGELKQLLSQSFGWAFKVNWTSKKQNARVWYTSAEKLEPRLGERFEEPVADYEQPLAPARDAARAYADLQDWNNDELVANFVLQQPEHRHTVRRAQLFRVAPYGEIRDNTIEDTMMPIDMLRAKLSFFGAIHFDPRSDRWVRICMFAGAPYPEELTQDNADYWIYPDLVR